MDGQIQVVVRLRPMSEREQKGNTLPVVTASTEKKEVTIIKGAGTRTLRSTFKFDNVFTSFSTQKEVFDQTLAPVIADVLDGYESTVFAYGQTGTGKTHTMEGSLDVPEDRGVIPRAAFDVFRRLKDDTNKFVEHKVTASFLEIYNEELCDLLADESAENMKSRETSAEDDARGNRSGNDTSKPSSDSSCIKGLRLVEDPGGPGKKKGKGVFVMGLTEEVVTSPEDVLALMRRASVKRQVGETKMNKQSSRSHCVFTMCVTSQQLLTDGSRLECAGKLHMVDLAGSECAKSAGFTGLGLDLDANRERERKNINQSLLTLGRVITLLKNGGKAKGERIPYRDSKLTRLLQESLGGRCKTCVIATVSPSAMSAEETLSTLQYAQSAHGIVNKPVAQSMLKLNVDGASRPTTARGDGTNMTGQTAQDWAEMETRMHYLKTQAEEAAAALARKHAEQSLLVLRAETAEGKVAAATKAVAIAETERMKCEELLTLERGEKTRLTTLCRARVFTEKKLTNEARGLLETLDAFAEAASQKTRALELASLEETNKRVLAARFGEQAVGTVHKLAAAAALTSKKLTAAHSAARSAARSAATAALAGQEAAATQIAATVDGAVSNALEASSAHAAHATEASKRRTKLSAKLDAAATAAVTAARRGADDAARSMRAVLDAFAVGEDALREWSVTTSDALRVSTENALALTKAHTSVTHTGVAEITNAVDVATALVAEQQKLLHDAAARLAAFAENADSRATDLIDLTETSEFSTRAAADALAATAAALEASKAAHERERLLLAELAAEITERVRKSSEAAQAAAFAAETARADATRAMERVNADAQVAASGFAKMKRGACDALGEARDVSEKVAKAARLAESVSSAHDAARAASEATVVAVCAAGTALGDAAAHSFQATEQSVMDFAATRPEVTLAAEKSNAVATANVTALAADAGATVDAVVGAVARFQTKETQFSHEVDVRTTEVSAKALAELREGAASATTSVIALAGNVTARATEVEGLLETASADVSAQLATTTTTHTGLARDVETHVRDVDRANQTVPKVEPFDLPRFSRALTATPADEIVLAGGVRASAGDTGDDIPDDISLAEDADMAEAVEVNPTLNQASVENTECDKERENRKPSMAAMRASKFAPGTKPARPALREVN